MENNLRPCKECAFYNPLQNNSDKGDCLLYELVSSAKRKFQNLTLTENSPCIYKLKSDQEIDLNEIKIIEIIKRVPGIFLGEISEEDIVLKQIKAIERTIRVFTRRD